VRKLMIAGVVPLLLAALPVAHAQAANGTFLNSTAPLTGEISIANPPPPPPLRLTQTVDSVGQVDHVSGTTTIGGTVSCSEPVTIFLNGTVVETVNRFAQATASFGQSFACTPGSSPVTWSAAVSSTNSVPFGPGRAGVGVTVGASDPAFNNFVTQHVDAVVNIH